MKAESDQEVEVDERRNPIKRAQRQKEFKTVGQLKQIISDPAQLYLKLNQCGKTFKSVRNNHPKFKQLTIIDFSLAARGPQEDQIYAKQPFYRNNIRRGNTLVYNSKTKAVSWGRKGLVKFFDISDKALKGIAKQDIAGLYKKDQSIYYNIFGQIENVLSCNEELQAGQQAKVHAYRLNKANGENCQVGYFQQTDQWVVSSKNVSIFVSQLQDLKLYKEQRYQFALLMAEAWFNIILKREKGQIEQLKKQLKGNTIVGQYCGNPDFQHLVKYGDITIYFYALVENTSPFTCVPPATAFEFFGKHKIPIVKNHQKSYFGSFVNFVQFGEALLNLFNQVSTASIFEDEEGSVVYFVLQKPRAFCEYVSDRYLQKSVPIPQDWQKRQVNWNVASLGKLKTLQYRILRKLREKLKYYTRTKKGGEDNNKEKNENDQKKLEERYGSFERQVYRLVKDKQLSKPLQYFFCAAIIAFQYVFKNRKNQRNLALLADHYLDFLSVIFWCIENKREVTNAMMTDEAFHKELRGTNWQEYSIDIVTHYPELLEKLAPRYAKIKKSMNLQDEDELEGNEDKEEQL